MYTAYAGRALLGLVWVVAHHVHCLCRKGIAWSSVGRSTPCTLPMQEGHCLV